MSMWEDVKVLTFDFYGTLFDWEGSVREDSERLLRRHGAQIDVRNLLQLWRSRQLEYSMVNTLVGRGHERFIDITRHALLYALGTYGIHPGEKDLGALVWLWEALRPFPDVESALSRLRTKYRLVILSNGDSDILAKNARLCSVEFDAIVSADMAGAYKPSPKIYLKALEVLGFGPKQVMHVARAQFDVFGARSAGIPTTWVNRGREPWPEGYLKPDHEVRDIGELADLARV